MLAKRRKKKKGSTEIGGERGLNPLCASGNFFTYDGTKRKLEKSKELGDLKDTIQRLEDTVIASETGP